MDGKPPYYSIVLLVIFLTLRTEDTFKGIQRRKDKGKHYLCGAAYFNEELDAQYEQLKLVLPGVSADLEECVYRSQEQLAQSIHAEVGEIKDISWFCSILIVDRLLGVRAVVLHIHLKSPTRKKIGLILSVCLTLLT